ncbi:DUF4906 domain-containing protein [Bacteroides sp.]|uniref:DUF4906 domain-containing protein n=1 Tax=Bacteroides sp. TaxID=29523 RepID=UPI00260ACFA6|nr:DUF4906 domain-containing protein [Bacteroides sp.]
MIQKRSLTGLAVFMAFVLFSCTDDGEPTGNNDKPDGILTAVSLSLDASPMEGAGGVTRSEESALNLVLGAERVVVSDGATTRAVTGDLTDAQEKIVNNVCVFQFKSDGILAYKEYSETLESATANISLMAGVGTCKVYVLANVGNVTGKFEVNSATEENFKKSYQEYTSSITTNSCLPMCGTADFDSDNVSATLSVSLTRLVAKVTLALTAANGTFTATSVTLRNVPKRMGFVDSQVASSDMVSYDGGTATNVVWYMPENKQGTGSVSSATDWTHRFEGTAPEKATYICIKGNYTPTGSTVREVVYSIYLGAAADANNFDVVRNTKYNVSAAIKGTNLADARVMVGQDLSVDAAGKSVTANSYLVNSTGKWYRFKGTIRGNGSTKTDVTTLPEGVGSADMKISPGAAELVWETGKHGGVIEYVGWSASGYVTFKTGNLEEGNAVLAVKANPGDAEALWSWHIWKTSFDLAGLSRDHVQTYKTRLRHGMSPTLYWDGFTTASRDLVMMDRDLGSASNTPSNTDDVTKTFGLYYQFGRKDPFPTASTRERRSDNNSEIVDVFDKEGNKLTAATLRGSAYQVKNINVSTDAQGIITYAMKHPLIFILRDDNDKSANGGDGTNPSYNWIYGAHPANFTASKADPTSAWVVSNKLWGGQFTDNKTSLRLDTKFTGKTIYDPCPPGWCMPPQDTWTNFTTTNTGEATAITDYNTSNTDYYNCPVADKANYADGDGKGFMLVPASGVFGRRYYVSGVGTGDMAFYPAAGYRYGGNGQVCNVGYGCYAWSSAPFQASSQYGGFLGTYIGWVSPVNSTFRSDAFPVRCVQESSVTE